MTTGGSPLLKISGLTVSHKSRVLLNDVSITLSRGQGLGILGESGAGKSMLASAILGLLPQSLQAQGDLQWEGTPLSQTVSTLRGKDIAYIPQSPLEASFPVYTLRRQWEDVCQATGTPFDIKKAETLLDSLGLHHPARILASFPHELSGGQLQRVLIAMAVTARPKLLIADEPTTALDTVNQAQILRLIRDFCQREQVALIFITHDISIVRQVCQHLVVLKNGSLVESGPLETVTANPRNAYTKALLEAHDRLLSRRSSASNGRNTSAGPVLQSTNLSISYPGSRFLWKREKPTTAVIQASIALYSGSIVGLAGSSGSGKTTLLRAMAGLFPSALKNLLFQGKTVAQMSEPELMTFRKSVQVIYQNPGSSLNPRHSVRQVLSEALKKENETKWSVKDLLDWVKLPEELLNQYPSQLSGGEKQRLCIARSLALQPKVLLCDEPTSSLDQSIQAEILDLFLYLKKELNLGILLVSHNLAAIRHTCDFVHVMAEGEIKEAGLIEHVLANPASDFTRQLIEAEPALTHNFL